MPDPTRAGRTPLRLVDPDVPAPADPFAAPRFVFRNSGRPVHLLPPPAGHCSDARAVGVDAGLLAGLPDDPALLVWPSQVWNDHEPDCARPRRCAHLRDLVWPDWWVLTMRRGAPLDADIETAIEIAMRRVNTYRGGKHVSSEGAAFTRDAVRDALPGAPQPVSKVWVNGALAITGQFATWVHNEGEPLTREHVFAEATRRRYLTSKAGPMHLSEYSRRNYRLRLDIMASILLGSRRETISGRKPIGRSDALMPLTVQQEVDLWVWAEGLRPISRRQRLQAVIVMGLGVGCRRRDFVTVRGTDVTRDGAGVHVSFPETTTTLGNPFPPRVTTCAAQWEDRLWDLVQQLDAPDRYLAAPWTDEQPTSRTVDVTMRGVINDEAARPPLDFSTESLRNTWLLRHLEAGTPPKVFMAQGALKTTVTLENLMPYVSTPSTAQAAAWMRRTR